MRSIFVSGGGPQARNELERFVMLATHEISNNLASDEGEQHRQPKFHLIFLCIGKLHRKETCEPNIFENIYQFLDMTMAV